PGSRVLQKRQPLHEEGREILIAVPLRNFGPGVAIGVTALLETDSQEIIFESTDLLLGNIAPGEFVAVFQALVLSGNPGFSALVTVTWQEVGDAERKSVTFDANVAAQKSDIDWPSLAYERPYIPDVAKGEAFVGRKEKVLALANRLLRSPMESFYVTG